MLQMWKNKTDEEQTVKTSNVKGSSFLVVNDNQHSYSSDEDDKKLPPSYNLMRYKKQMMKRRQKNQVTKMQKKAVLMMKKAIPMTMTKKQCYLKMTDIKALLSCTKTSYGQFKTSCPFLGTGSY